MGGVDKIMKGASVFTFRDGMETIVRAVDKALHANPNIAVLKNTGVESIAKDSSNGEFIVSLFVLSYLRAD